MDIVKDPTTRLITFSQSGEVVQTLGENVTARLNARRNGIELRDLRGKGINLFTSQVDTYQLLPNPAVKFQPQGTLALWDLLFDPAGLGFFTDLRIKFGGGGTAGLATKSGIVSGPSFAGTPLTAAVVFTTPFVSNSYSVTVTGENGRIWTISGKSANGFTINSNSIFSISGNVFWQAILQGET